MAEINYTPAPAQQAFMQSEAFVRGIIGPYGSGKSVTCVMELLRRAAEQAPAPDGIRYTRFAVIRNTNRMLEDTTIQTVHEWIPPGQAGEWRATRKNFTLRFGDVQSEWWFRALDTPDDVKNLLSMELTAAWINEFREVHPDVLINLVGRVGRYRGPGKVKPSWTGIIMDSNPPAMDSFYYNFFEEALDAEMEAIERKIAPRSIRSLHKQPSGLSPEAENLENLPDNYYELMVANNRQKGEEWINVHVHGQYGYLHDGEPVYRGFRQAVHVASRPLRADPGKTLSIGVDFGLTPAAAVFQQNARGQWLCLSELTTPRQDTMGAERFAQALLRHLRSRHPDCRALEVWADPAGQQRSQADEKTCYQVLRAAGFIVRPGPQDLATRVGSVQRIIDRMVDGEPGLLYDASCKELIKGKLGAYHYRSKKTVSGELVEEPVKNDASHVADAEQYVIGAYEGPALKGRAPRKWGRASAAIDGPVKIKQNWKVYT